MVTGFWLPEGVTHKSPYLAGMNMETGGGIVAHTFHFLDKKSGRRSKCVIPADDSMSQNQIESMAATAFENWLEEIRTDGRKRAPTREERKEIGKALREFKEYATKRGKSSNGLIYYRGITIGGGG